MDDIPHLCRRKRIIKQNKANYKDNEREKNCKKRLFVHLTLLSESFAREKVLFSD